MVTAEAKQTAKWFVDKKPAVGGKRFVLRRWSPKVILVRMTVLSDELIVSKKEARLCHHN